MKKTNKFLSILLAVCIVLTTFAISASAATVDINAGSSLNTATNIPSYGVDYASSLSKAGEQDWYKFTTKSNEAYYTLSLKNYNIPASDNSPEYSLKIDLYDKNMQHLGHNFSGTNNTSSINIKLETSTTYYIVIKIGAYAYDRPENIGNYQLTVNYKDDHTPNEMSNASSISLNKTKIESLDGTGDYDWYKFTTSSKRAEYIINLKNYDIPAMDNSYGYSLNVELYDKNMQNLGQTLCGTGRSHTITATLEANKTYYILIKMGDFNTGSTGNYEFSVNTNAPVVSKTLKSISVTKPNKTEYSIGESFNSSGMVVKATYSDGSNETLSSGSYTVSGFTSSSAGKKTITVSYTYGDVTKTATFSVTVKNSQGGGESGGGTSGGSTIINNIVNVINNIFVTIKSPFEQLINAIVKLFNTIFK